MDARLCIISKSDVSDMLGYINVALPENVSHQLDLCLEKIAICSTPLATYKIFDKSDSYLSTHILIGNDINALLADCDRVIVFAATLGMGVEAELLRLQVTDMAMAVIFDRCASCAIENVCDNLCTDFTKKYGHITERFSPGYGDCPFNVQQKLYEILDMQKRIGVTLSDSGLMIPQKSVTAIVGITDSIKPKKGRQVP